MLGVLQRLMLSSNVRLARTSCTSIHFAVECRKKSNIADGIRWAKRSSVMASARTRLITGYLMTRALASARGAEPRDSSRLMCLVGKIVTLLLAKHPICQGVKNYKEDRRSCDAGTFVEHIITMYLE